MEFELERDVLILSRTPAALRTMLTGLPREWTHARYGQGTWSAHEIVGHLVLVANAGELVPGRIGPREPIDPTDGRLELIVLGGAGPLEALHGAAALMLRTGELSGGVIRRSIREVTIESDPLQPIEIDGDNHPPTNLEVSVVPGAVSVLVPG